MPMVFRYALLAAAICDEPGCNAAPTVLWVMVPGVPAGQGDPIRCQFSCDAHFEETRNRALGRVRARAALGFCLPVRAGQVFDTNELRERLRSQLRAGNYLALAREG